MSKLVGTYDPITGELLGPVSINAEPVNARHPYRKWLFMNLLAFKVMKTCKRADDLRVFLALGERMGFLNETEMPLKDVASDLGMSVSQVSSALKRLQDAEIIKHLPDAKTRYKTYRLHDGLAWRGKTKDFPKDHIPWPSNRGYEAAPTAKKEAEHGT